jgi:hypothetical protein
VFLKNHSLNQCKIPSSIKEAQFYGVNKDEGSIRMKFQNIAQLCNEESVTIKSKTSSLGNNSKQVIIEFNNVKNFSYEQILLELFNIKKNS